MKTEETVPSKKTILFLSGIDFKEKSIQVISKTPQAYRDAGWKVFYIVGRDLSRNGDYYYEKEINIEGINIKRFQIPLSNLHSSCSNKIIRGFLSRIRNTILILQLAYFGRSIIKKHKIDVLYGYEVFGVLAARLLKKIDIGKECKFVTRFQGVLFVKEWLRKGNKLRFISNWAVMSALKTKESDLCIMTNDGSQGKFVLERLNSPQSEKCLFLRNGVEDPIKGESVEKVKKSYYNSYQNTIKIVSISRLDAHKRVYRCIKIVDAITRIFPHVDLIYTIIGEGNEKIRLETIIKDLGLQEKIRFLGAVNHKEISAHLTCNDIFLSMYDSTNVGNPLLEAITHNKLIVTLNNGETGELIQHKFNGLLYDVNDDIDLKKRDYNLIASDIINIFETDDHKEILANLKETKNNKLWSWTDRFSFEVRYVEGLIH